MICANCQTILPDEAKACWKCGIPLAESASVPKPKGETDLLMAILTFVLTAALFACVGWALPFMVWGTIVSSTKDYPQWSGVLDMFSGVSFFVTAIAFVAIVWRGSYWLITRVTRPSVP
jgi:uncharacterized paraquat-inducible protein A